jgi:hypothetical protein
MKTFPEVHASSYVLLEALTGSNIGTAADQEGVSQLLGELDEEDHQRDEYVAVVALDEKGQKIDAWPAASLLADQV